MESGNIQLGSSTIRRYNGRRNEAFPSSACGEDDEEALKWAALEKLPTYNRLRKGILTSPSGKAFEIDIPNLGFEERKDLVDRLLRTSEDGNEKFLLKLKNRIDRVGIDLPTIEVRFEHLNVEAEAYLGSRALPTLLNWTTNFFWGFFTNIGIITSRKTNFSILQNVSGIIKPNRMTLLLGPPSSGKTTLLLALAGKLHPDLKLSGTVTYNGHGMNEFIPQKTAAYISQYDVHIGEMTVRETLAFSARCQGVGTRYDMLAELARREKAANIKPDADIDVFMKATAIEGQEVNVVTDYVLKILGLEACADTIVGDAMLRGISGGQKKRVTTGEMLVGPTNALFMDEISTGLDSSTTFQIVNSLRQNIHILNGTAVISLLQPAPETYELFDDIILLSDGQIVYQGPREHVLEFFKTMGFKCPERKDIADFLQEVTSRKDQEQYWERKEDPYSFVTVTEFAKAFESFHVGQRLKEELSIPFDKRKNHPAALTTKKFSVKKGDLWRACISREFLLMKRNSFVYYFKITQITFMALVSMTMFLRTKMHHRSVDDATVYAGALFFGNTIIMFNGMSELPMTIMKLPVFYKQRDFFFYPAWAYALPTWILKVPISLAEVGIWVFMTYYVIGFDPNVGRLLKQYLLFLLVNQMASALFRAIAAFCREMVTAYSLGSAANLILFTLCGFTLSRDKINKLWKWGYWSSPLMYSQNAVVVNELLGKNWRHPVLPNSTVSIGVAALKYRSYFTQAYWYWIGVGALIGYVSLFNICYVIALTYLHQLGKTQAVKSEESVRIAEESTSSQPTIPESIHTEVAADAINLRKRGMILPFEPHSITFDEITYAVDIPKEMKMQGVVEDKLVLLKDVSGSFRPGVLTALMGASGAGKTTLMDVLAGRKTGGYIDGDVKISGYPKKQETFARISGYCEQTDIHSPQVTVYESLVYSAWLRLSPEVNSETRRVFIEEVMELVELNPLRQSLVGLPGISGLSTEQRKRLTIAVELVANPSIIFMDEPTSGLDARAAAIVMRTVRNTVDTGRTVVCTIHQPSIDIFEAFDELLLLKRGGQEIYAGPLGRHSCELIKYFEEIEGVRKIKYGHNPATWMLDISTSAQELALGIDFAHIYRKSELYRRNKQLIIEYSAPSPSSKELFFPTQYAQPFWIQSMACLWKQHWSYWRNPSYNAVRILFTLSISLIFGTMFWNLGSKTETRQDLFNAMGCMYTAVLFMGIRNSLSVQPVVGIERTVFYREKAAGMYTALAYAFAQVVIELPYLFAQTLVYGATTYLMIGFERKFVKFVWYMFYMYFSFTFCTFYGMMVVALTPNYQIASVVSTLFYGLWNLFSGFLIPRPRIPIWWTWYYWACPISWTLYGLVASQYGDLDNMLDNGETVEQFLRQYFGFKHDFVGVVAVVPVGFSLLFAFIFAFSIRALNFQKR